MSIMGMREWFRKNRVMMAVVFVLLLIGILISYGRFGSSSTYTAADYKKMVEDARAAYAEDPTAPENVLTMYQTLYNYVQYLSANKGDQEEIKALDAEAVGYYDEYYGLLAEEAKTTYQSEPNYANAYTVANYLFERYRAQASMEGMEGGAAMQAEVTNWMIVAMGHKVDEDRALLAENPTDSVTLADLGDAVGALAYYRHEQDSSYDLTASYQESLDLFQQAIDNCPADAEPAVLASYYLKKAECAFNMNDTAQAEELYQTVLAKVPADFNANMEYASFLLNVGRIDECLAALEAYKPQLSEDDPNYQTFQQYYDSVVALKEQLDNPPADDENGGAENNEAGAN